MTDTAAQSSIKIKLFLMMILEIAIWGAWQIKIFSYMTMLGFNPDQQWLVGSAFGIASIVGIFFSNQFADRNFSAERFLAFSHVIGGLALIATAFQTSFWPFFACFITYCLLYVPTISVTNSLAFANLKDPAKDFGFVRMGGTIGWIVVSWPFIFLLSEKAGASETKWVFIVAGIISLVLAVFSLTLPHTPPRKDVEGMDKVAWLKALKLLGNPFVLVLFIVTFIDSTIHNGYFVVIDGFLQKVGISANMSMVVSSIGQVAEIVTMLILGTVLKKLGWKTTLIIGIIGHAARFSIFAFFGTPENQWLIIAVQVLHGICYAFFFVTVYIFVDAVFPKDIRSSAQGLFNLLILGIGMVVASKIFPELVVKYTVNGVVDYHQLFLVPTGMALAGIVLLALFFKPPTYGPEGEVKH
ncbi:nucleoside permease [Prosthecobacter sp.]|mgnify:FL=1|jgi:nucleoside transporter|uniref:nucleoside permease n=2 Tax=Prosthecobacter sp. TaxID=1965333 RepID=UPI0037C98B35